MRQMEERRTEMGEAERGLEEKEDQAGDAAPPPKKKKRDKKTVKTMTKEERQKHSEERKEERKAKAQKRKKEQEEKEQEKARLKREAHKEVLKKAKELLSRTAVTSTVVPAEDIPTLPMTPSEPSTSRLEDPLETSLVESGPQLVSLTPFEEGEEEVIRPTSTGAARVLSQTISIEGDVPKPQKVIAGKEPRSAVPKSAGPKPAGSKTVARRAKVRSLLVQCLLVQSQLVRCLLVQSLLVQSLLDRCLLVRKLLEVDHRDQLWEEKHPGSKWSLRRKNQDPGPAHCTTFPQTEIS